MAMADVELVCQYCFNYFTVKFKLRSQKYCSRNCVNSAFSGTGNPAYGKTYRTKESNPEWCKKISKTLKDREVNKGVKNGMKNPDVAKRVGKTRSKRFKDDPSFGKQYSICIRKAWAEGKFNHVPVGRCKWYDHIKPDGASIKLQGTWEVVLARHMDFIQLDYKAHRGRFVYVDNEGVERSYYPDFYIPMWDSYIDVKGAFFSKLQKEKFDWIRSSNPDINICLITKEDFKQMGINVTKISKEIRDKFKEVR